MRTSTTAALAMTLLAGGLVPAPAMAAPHSTAAPVPTVAPFDFNGDGYADLTVSVPGEDVGRVVNAGAVSVIYGSRTGLRAARNQIWTQASRGIPGQPTAGGFGSFLTSGDYDRDGFADLAIRADDVGAVVLHGSREGLSARGVQTFDARRMAPGGSYTRLGGLVTGDFNGDRYSDLVAGYAIGEDDPVCPAGVVFWGSASGLASQGMARTGNPVAGGDLTGDGIDDLVQDSSCNHPDEPNLLTVNLGSATGLATGYTLPAEVSTPVVADVDADGRGELVVTNQGGGGMQLEVRAVSAIGLGEPSILTRSDLALPEHHTWAGLAAGDITGDGAVDLLLPLQGGRMVVGTDDASRLIKPFGAVAVILGTPGIGIAPQRARVWSQATRGVRGTDERQDGFGATVEIGRFRASRYSDVAIGAPGENQGRGRVTVLRGVRTGLTTRGQQVWSQNSKGIKDRAERGDAFGMNLESW